MAKKRKYFHEADKLLNFPTSKLKRLFLKAKSINGSKEDARFALNNALNAFIQDVVQGTISIAIENDRNDTFQENTAAKVVNSSSYDSSEIDEEEDEEDQSSQFKLRLNVGHLKEYLDSNKNKFDFLDDTFDKYNSETLFNNNENKEEGNEKKARLEFENDPNEDLYITKEESSCNKHKKKKSPASIEIRAAISRSTSSAKTMALSIRHKEDFGNLDEVVFDGEEMDFN